MQNDVVAMQHGLEVLCLVVNQDICAEGFHELEIGGACCGGDRRTQMFRQLDGECPDATGARLDEDLLPGLQVRPFD